MTIRAYTCWSLARNIFQQALLDEESARQLPTCCELGRQPLPRNVFTMAIGE